MFYVNNRQGINVSLHEKRQRRIIHHTTPSFKRIEFEVFSLCFSALETTFSRWQTEQDCKLAVWYRSWTICD